jgi:hypothetical protein
MPNIIEQQDLLKGLPDARLMTLLQKPMGDIPPFLVAAEAQRRQQIRQQFAGSGSKESVVDTLTKQLANVPQNVNAPARTPPMIPQTPPMQGVMALQQQQEMADMAQQGQTMRSGGMVQRYNNGSLVSSSPQRLKWVMENFDLPNEQAAQKFIMAHPEAGLGSELNFPADMSTVDRLAQSVAPTQQLNSLVDSVTASSSPDKKRIFPSLPAGAPGGMNFNVPPKAPATPVAPPPPEPDETPDEYRARIEKLLAAQEPSGWENAQKYFAMAQQFLDPSKTTMESLVGAGQAFSQSAGEQARAQREAKLALERGLLEYDMEKAQSREEAEQNASKNRVESFKYQADQALREAELYRKTADDAKSELNDYIKSSVLPPEAEDPRVIELKKRIQDANGNLNEAVRRSQYYNYQYGKTFGTYGAPAFWDPANPDVLSQ